MEETKSISSTDAGPTEVADLPEVAGLPKLLRHRGKADVPEDVDFLMEHLNDPNLDLRAASRHSFDGHRDKKSPSHYSGAASDVDTESHFGSEGRSTSRAESRYDTGFDFENESPYPEVRAAVANVDDPAMPVNTFRMWFLGITLLLILGGINMVFSFRYPSVFISGIVVQLVALPLGKALERVLPTTRFRLFGRVWSLNPGPFNIKEHVCITVMSNVFVSGGGAYATDIVASQRIFYHQNTPFGYQVMLILSTQIFGFAFGGLLRQFVVWPASMVWPGVLVNCALFNTLHRNYGQREPGHISRERFFCIAMACSFVWYWVPGFLFTALSMFNWVCWIAPNNVVVNTLFGTNTGLGMGLLTFDWTMITYIGSPLVTPWWSELNTTAALVICFWFITPILYFTNTFYSKYMPISTFTIYDNTGQPYNVSSVITDDRFDEEKYKQYSPMYVSTVLAMYWAVAFAAFTSVVVHTFLWFRRDIARRLRNTIKDEGDFHSRLMRAYPEVPHWWYICVGVPSFALLFAAIETYPTDLPIWGAVVGVVLALILALPSAILRAITNQLVVTNVLAEMIAGYLFPGRPVANMIFKSIVIMGTAQPVTFAGDLKLGHYMKVPPRMMFIVQLVAVLISCFLVLGVQQWMFAHVVDFCAPDQPNGFVCYPTRFFATASFIWGGIGPARLFSPGSMYHPLLYFFLIGAILPVPFYFLARRYPLSFWRYVNIPVFFSGVGILLPATGMNYASWAITGFIFNYFIRRYHFRWWMRYNYILSAALDSGVGLALVFIFFCVQYPTNGFTLNWWGNTVWQKTADALGTPLITLQQGQTFGPTTWS